MTRIRFYGSSTALKLLTTHPVK